MVYANVQDVIVSPTESFSCSLFYIIKFNYAESFIDM